MRWKFSDASPYALPRSDSATVTFSNSSVLFIFNLSTPESRSGECVGLLDTTIARLPTAARRRMVTEREAFIALYDHVKRAKKTLLLYDWVTGTPTREVESRFHCFSGSAHGLAVEFAWLAETLAGVAKILSRPEEESVIAAVRRLSQTYHMLDKGQMLHETSSLVTAHVVQGRPAPEVIDELQTLFESRYHEHLEKRGS